MSETISPDSRIAHYRIVSRIGSGGMGDVYLAEDTRLDRKIALKILPADVASDKDRLGRFIRERHGQNQIWLRSLLEEPRHTAH